MMFGEKEGAHHQVAHFIEMGLLITSFIVFSPEKILAKCWALPPVWTNCDESKIKTEHNINANVNATETVALISEELRKRSVDVPKNLVDAFTDGTNVVLNEQVLPLLMKLESSLDNTIDRTSARADQLIDKTFKNIIPILDNALALARDTSQNWTPAKLEEHIILSSKNAVLEIEKHFFADLNNLIGNTACIAEGSTKRIMDEALSRIPEMPVFDWFSRDKCRKKLNLWIQNAKLGPLQAFNLIECNQLLPLDNKTPAKSIVGAYAALEYHARRLRCVSKSTGTEEEARILLELSLDHGQRAKFWKELSR